MLRYVKMFSLMVFLIFHLPVFNILINQFSSTTCPPCRCNCRQKLCRVFTCPLLYAPYMVFELNYCGDRLNAHQSYFLFWETQKTPFPSFPCTNQEAI